MTRSFRRPALFVAAAMLCVLTTVYAAGDEHYKNGYNLFKQKQYAEAVAALVQSSEMSGNDYNFFLLLANAYMQAKQFDKVAEPARKAAGIDSSKKEPHVLMGSAYLKSENFAAAAKAFEAAAKFAPGDYQMNYFLGYAQFKAENYQGSTGPLEKALAAKPNDFNALYTLGTAYAKLKDCDKAKATLEKAAAQQPKQAETIRGLMMGCYSTAGDTEKAVKMAEEKLKQNPKDVASLEFLAASYMASKDWDKAQDAYQKLAAAKPKDGDSQFNIAQIKVMQKDYPGAIAAYEKALAVENKCEWRTSLGSMYQTMAVELDNKLNESLEKDPEATPDQKMLDEMIANYTKATGEFNKAVKACKSADAKKGLAAVKERVAAWTKYSQDAKTLEEGGTLEEPEGEQQN